VKDCICPDVGHVPPCRHFPAGAPAAALDARAPVTAKDALAIVLSDISVQCHEAIKTKDFARAIVWCEVGLSIVLVDKQVRANIQEAGGKTREARPFTEADIGKKVRVRVDAKNESRLYAGQFGTVCRILRRSDLLVSVQLDSGVEVWLASGDLERGKHARQWVAE
jgi:hypothetical protein